MNPQNESLSDSLIADGYLKTPEIINAFKKIDRADFVPDEFKNDAYENIPLPIGFKQTISQPLTVAFMIELLQPRAGEKILEVGAGSGWQTAILSQMVGGDTGGNEGGENSNSESGIIAIEIIPELKEMAEKNVSKYNFIHKGIAKIILGDGSRGYKNEAPFDRIIAAAASEKEIPAIWKKQLKIGGRIVSPVGHSIVVIDKISKTKYAKREYFGFSFVPLLKDA